MAKISFLVTYYNQEKFVNDSLESIFALDIPCDFEILVGDDGSIDDTINQVKIFQEKYSDKIKIFQIAREQDKKYNFIHRAAANRLNLVEHAVGDYLMFLDGDDFYCDKNFLTEAIKNIEENQNIVGSAFNFKYIYPDKEKTFENIPQNGILKSEKFVSNYYIPAGAIVFKNILDKEKITFLKNCKNFDDNVISVYFSQFGDFIYSSKVIYGYRQSSNSIWNSYSKIEQNILNAMDYEILCKIAPKMKKYILKRQFGAIKALFKERNNITKLLSKIKIEKYIKQNEDLNNNFVTLILNWGHLPVEKKIKFCLWINLNKYIKDLY